MLAVERKPPPTETIIAAAVNMTTRLTALCCLAVLPVGAQWLDYPTKGIPRLPDGKANLEVAGQGLVGLAFAPGRSVILTTTSAVHHLLWNIQGLPLLPE